MKHFADILYAVTTLEALTEHLTPIDFKREGMTADEFREFLLEHAKEINQSDIHRGNLPKGQLGFIYIDRFDHLGNRLDEKIVLYEFDDRVSDWLRKRGKAEWSFGAMADQIVQ